MRARHPALETTHMEESLLQVELIPPQINEFGDAQAMPIGQENHRVIAQAMSADTPGCLAEAFDLGGGQVLPRADVSVFVAFGKGELWHADLLPKDFPVFDAWP